MKNKTWNEFWGEFLQITFHEGHPDLWPARQRKAIWVQTHAGLQAGAKILNLGCGDGMVDIWLSRMGYAVTAVDRNANVLEKAKATDDTGKARFLAGELQDAEFPAQSFDAVILMEALGLMSKEDEFSLFQKIHSWLKPGGAFIVDGPEVVEMKNSWTREFPNGTARGVSGFNEATRIQDIQFYFQPRGQEEFGIYDPYDVRKGDVPGIMRYIYPKTEIKQVLENAGFACRDIPHYYEKNYFGVLAGKK